ncbi:MAG: adenine nucleotide alpha hydrolase [Candidatus Polarisedimenticolaceae bacterium]|nr:adenine nucleotide alpha hydrolase [Candidatus Polarisedimenticolaceae bacterium]
MKKRVWLSWSSGKDSAWALYILRQQADVEVVGLISTVNQTFERVSMHAVRIELLQRQAASVGLPVHLIEIPYPCSNEQYELIMAEFIREAQQQKIEAFAFGDLYLEDIRQYREKNLEGSGISALFPLWQIATDELSQTMIASGLRAKITCVDPKHLPAHFSGREFDLSLLQQLPEGIDPCGENGEFHSFAYDGPMFSEAIAHSVGETVERDGFIYTDLLPE